MYPRPVRPLIIEALSDTQIVLIAAARQVGKTTLAAEVITDEHPMTAYTLDRRLVVATLVKPIRAPGTQDA